jgi:hypothetical protein
VRALRWDYREVDSWLGLGNTAIIATDLSSGYMIVAVLGKFPYHGGIDHKGLCGQSVNVQYRVEYSNTYHQEALNLGRI